MHVLISLLCYSLLLCTLPCEYQPSWNELWTPWDLWAWKPFLGSKLRQSQGSSYCPFKDHHPVLPVVQYLKIFSVVYDESKSGPCHSILARSGNLWVIMSAYYCAGCSLRCWRHGHDPHRQRSYPPGKKAFLKKWKKQWTSREAPIASF